MCVCARARLLGQWLLRTRSASPLPRAVETSVLWFPSVTAWLSRAAPGSWGSLGSSRPRRGVGGDWRGRGGRGSGPPCSPGSSQAAAAPTRPPTAAGRADPLSLLSGGVPCGLPALAGDPGGCGLPRPEPGTVGKGQSGPHSCVRAGEPGSGQQRDYKYFGSTLFIEVVQRCECEINVLNSLRVPGCRAFSEAHQPGCGEGRPRTPQRHPLPEAGEAVPAPPRPAACSKGSPRVAVLRL